MIYMLRMMKCVFVCHEKSSLPTSQLSAGGAKGAARQALPSLGWLWPRDDDDDDGRDELFIVVVEQAASAFRFFLLFSSGLRVGQENKFYFGNTIMQEKFTFQSQVLGKEGGDFGSFNCKITRHFSIKIYSWIFSRISIFPFQVNPHQTLGLICRSQGFTCIVLAKGELFNRFSFCCRILNFPFQYYLRIQSILKSSRRGLGAEKGKIFSEQSQTVIASI